MKNTTEERENEVFGDPLELIWKNCVFDFCGVTNFYRTVFRVIDVSTVEQRQTWLREVPLLVQIMAAILWGWLL